MWLFTEVMDPLNPTTNPTTVTTGDFCRIESKIKRHLTQYLMVNVVSKSSSAILDFGCSSDTLSGREHKTRTFQTHIFTGTKG